MGRKAAPPPHNLLDSNPTTADALFAGTLPVHRLRPRARRVLAAAASLRATQPGSLDTLPPTQWPTLLPDSTPAERTLLTAVMHRLTPTEPDTLPTPNLRPEFQTQVDILAALLRLAETLDRFGPAGTRLESVTVGTKHITLHLSGPRAKATALAAGETRRWWRPAFKTGLAFKIAPLAPGDLELLAAASRAPTTPLFETIQSSLAAASLVWERALAQCTPEQPAAAAAALRATEGLRQLLTAYRPHLRQRATERLRSSLSPVRRLLQKAAATQAVLADITGYQDAQSADVASQLASLCDSAASNREVMGHTLLNSLNAAVVRDLSTAVRAFIGDLPLRQDARLTTTEATPGLLQSAADHLARRQATFSATDPASRRRVAHSVLRLEGLFRSLDINGRFGSDGTALLADLNRAAVCLDTLGWLDSVERAVAAYLDAWAERQGRRKAPQMHGAEAVLEYRQARRAERARQLRALNDAWKPLRSRKLARRLSDLLQVVAAPAP